MLMQAAVEDDLPGSEWQLLTLACTKRDEMRALRFLEVREVSKMEIYGAHSSLASFARLPSRGRLGLHQDGPVP